MPMRSALFVAFSALAAALGPRSQTADPSQPPKPVFPSQIDAVRLDIVALDESNRPVPDLTQEEIWILENGKKQEIVSFVPIRHSIPSTYRAVANDVASNPSDAGRLIFLVLDDSNSMKKRTAFVQEAATRLVERLSPEDWVGMLFVSQNRRGSLEFTQDHALVLRAIRAFAGEESTVERWFGKEETRPGPTRLHLEGMDAGFDMPRPEGAQSGDLPAASLKANFDADRPLLIVKGVSDRLRNIEGRRRVMVYIGQGALRQSMTAIGFGDRPVPDGLLPTAIEAARNANVTYYAIDVSDPATRNARGPTAKEGTHVGELSLVSSATGGVTARYSNPTDAADHVVEDTSVYYLAGYSPAAPVPGERARRIEVLTTRPGVRILARKTYLPSPKEPPATPRVEAARSVRDLLPVNDLSLRAFAAPFAEGGQKKPQVAVVLEVTLPENALSPRAAFAEDIDVTMVAALPGKGAEAGQVNARVTLGEEKAREFNGRYLVCARIGVDPGRYQLRIGAKSSAAARTGSVYLDLLVPDFANEAVSLSGLVIEQKTSRDPMPVARREALAPVLSFIPSLTREFTRADEAWAFTRAYRGKEGGKFPISMKSTITRLDDGTTVWTSPEEPASDRPSAEYRVALPLSQLSIGSYRLRVEAAGASKASRELDFRVARD